jgi:hypothetical protein
VQYSASATTSVARSATLTIGGQAFTVNQGSGCTIALSASGANVPAGGARNSVDVATGAGCPWTAASGVPWITISSGSSGSGNGTVAYTVDASSGPQRSGVLTIGGQTFTVTQANGCSISLSPTSANVPASGAKNSVGVTAGAGCPWNASSAVAWISIASGGNGSGNGTVGYTVDASSGPARSGALTIGGQTFTVNQASGCNYQVNPTSFSVPFLGGTRSVSVTVGDQCDWSVTINANSAAWITVTNPSPGSGSGSREFVLQPNVGGSRTGTVTIAGQTVTFNQNGPLGLAPQPVDDGPKY